MKINSVQLKNMETNHITEQILKCAFKVHSALGPGLLESAYQACLKYEIIKSGLYVESEKALPLIYEEVKLDCGYRLDLLVEKEVIVELKTVEFFTDVHLAQVLTYLKISNKKVGLLINFNTKSLRDGIKRVVL
ncbi:GxxExxY protein [Aquiflexum balticum DSM 16537]|uniref:GxxExxY protein n=2 Tax=Aquiflexum TaxID=280472 RepID=A0A1W2HB27_9BACT|nr:GxxExxY protein [Aquiflexum balticum DSM 16537]